MKQYKIIPLILTFLTAGNVSAADLDTLKVVDVEEVLVIAAPKENRKLREQPTAVTLLSQQDMQAAQVNSIKNLTGLVPNMYIPDYGSRLTSAVYIRGIGSRINTPSVGLYVDNIPYIDKSAFDFDYSDIERIDVLRGPQGTLYGRNAMGGLIKIHTKSPFSYQGTDLRIGAGTHNAYNTSLTHYHRVSERFAFSTGGFYDYEGGFFRNAALNNKKIDKGQSAGGRFRGIYLPSENWKADLNVSYEYSDQGGYPYYYTGSVNPAAQSEEMKSYIGTISNNRESSYYRNLLNTGLNLEYQAQRRNGLSVPERPHVHRPGFYGERHLYAGTEATHPYPERRDCDEKQRQQPLAMGYGRLWLLPVAENRRSGDLQGRRHGNAGTDAGQCNPVQNRSSPAHARYGNQYPAVLAARQQQSAHQR